MQHDGQMFVFFWSFTHQESQVDCSSLCYINVNIWNKASIIRGNRNTADPLNIKLQQQSLALHFSHIHIKNKNETVIQSLQQQHGAYITNPVDLYMDLWIPMYVLYCLQCSRGSKVWFPLEAQLVYYWLLVYSYFPNTVYDLSCCFSDRNNTYNHIKSYILQQSGCSLLM